MPTTPNEQECIDCDWEGFDHQTCPKCNGTLIEK